MYMSIALATCFMLLAHCTVAAARRAFLSAGSNTAISTAMIAITTSSSTSVNARRSRFDLGMGCSAFISPGRLWQRRRHLPAMPPFQGPELFHRQRARAAVEEDDVD